MPLTTMTFFERFEADILSGKKTITIRDEHEKDFAPGSTVEVSTFEDNRWFCRLNIESVTPIVFDDLTEQHAVQENMTLDELKAVIRDIYPEVVNSPMNSLYVIEFELAK